MLRFLAICLGGAFGTGARYLLSEWVRGAAGTGFPFGTLAVNAIGCFALGVLVPVGAASGAAGGFFTPTLRLALTTGVMGGFTTYSTFNHETLVEFERGAVATGLLNVGVTLALCLLCGVAGLAVGRALVAE